MPSEQIQKLVQMLRARPIASPDTSVEETRAGFEKMADGFPTPEDVRREPVTVNGVPAEWITAPGAVEDRVIFYLHGGGYVIGSINTHREMVARLSRASAARALAIDYRLAPEHPFPAAVDDAMAAYRWLLGSGVNPRRIVVAGDSAGGGLTMATLVALRDAGEPLPAAGVCLSPWVDLEGTGDSMSGNAAVDPIVQRDGLVQMAKRYLGEAGARTPLAAPLYADLTGLPPLLIQVGATETLLDDSVRLDARARAAGVDSTLEVWDDMIHVWHIFAGMLPEGQQAIQRIGEFVKKHTG